MRKYIEGVGRQIVPGAEIKLDPDRDLRDYRRGAPLTMGELRRICAGKKRAAVWVYCKAADERHPRVECPYWATKDDRTSFSFEDGSSFFLDMDNDGPDDVSAEDEKDGWGIVKIFAAVKLKEKP